MGRALQSTPLSVIQQRASSRDVPNTCPKVVDPVGDKVDKDPVPVVTVPRVFLAPGTAGHLGGPG